MPSKAPLALAAPRENKKIMKERLKSQWDRMLDDFYLVAECHNNDGTAKSEEDWMSTPTTVTPLSSDSLLDGWQILQPTVTGTNEDLLSPIAISHQVQNFETSCMAHDSSDVLNRRVEALEKKPGSDTPASLVQRVTALETNTFPSESDSLQQRANTAVAERESEGLVKLERRFKTLEATMASESSTALVQRLAAVEKNDQIRASDNKKFQTRLDQMSVRLDNMTTRLRVSLQMLP
ncbi:hypothetical protein B0J13DRAFT_519295 [Dactylonectria estremocensis]|uniref:Uncharacterized protein n=1 Tax=Dactylonectria estremocensis TaxID=1079267 RepID=A0A9P9FBE6_9HYPO|nr:hypothetical protein B0J13DRAFT_519295 [Dactylonectria estremocensis]